VVYLRRGHLEKQKNLFRPMAEQWAIKRTAKKHFFFSAALRQKSPPFFSCRFAANFFIKRKAPKELSFFFGVLFLFM